MKRIRQVFNLFIHSVAGIALSSRVLPNDITAAFSRLSQNTQPLTFSSKKKKGERKKRKKCECVCVSVCLSLCDRRIKTKKDRRSKKKKKKLRKQPEKQSALQLPQIKIQTKLIYIILKNPQTKLKAAFFFFYCAKLFMCTKQSWF